MQMLSDLDHQQSHAMSRRLRTDEEDLIRCDRRWRRTFSDRLSVQLTDLCHVRVLGDINDAHETWTAVVDCGHYWSAVFNNRAEFPGTLIC